MILSIRILIKAMKRDNAIQSLKRMKKGLHLLGELVLISEWSSPSGYCKMGNLILILFNIH